MIKKKINNFRKSIDSLKGGFLHIHRGTNKQKNGIISTLLSSYKKFKIGSGKINTIKNKINNLHINCKECNNNEHKFLFGGFKKKNYYIENKDYCFTGTKIKLHKPKTIYLKNGKKIDYSYKTIVRKCNKHEIFLKHK